MLHRIQAFLLIFVLYSSTTLASDILSVKKMEVTPDVRMGNVSGIRFKVKFILSKDKTAKKSGASIRQLSIVLTENEVEVLPVNSIKSRYSIFHQAGDEKGKLVLTYNLTETALEKEDSISYFMPYYVLRLPPNEHKLKATLKVQTYTLNEYFEVVLLEDKSVTMNGNTSTLFTFSKPIIKRFYVQILNAQIDSTVYSRDMKWENTSDTKPDLFYTIEFDFQNNTTDKVYKSEFLKQKYIAKWEQYSSEISLTKGDLVRLNIYDLKVNKDVFVAGRSFTLEELLQISSANKPISIGMVNNVLLKVIEN